MVQEADPTYFADQRRVLEFEFTRRCFYHDPRLRGPYDPLTTNAIFQPTVFRLNIFQ